MTKTKMVLRIITLLSNSKWITIRQCKSNTKKESTWIGIFPDEIVCNNSLACKQTVRIRQLAISNPAFVAYLLCHRNSTGSQYSRKIRRIFHYLLTKRPLISNTKTHNKLTQTTKLPLLLYVANLSLYLSQDLFIIAVHSYKSWVFVALSENAELLLPWGGHN